MDLDELKAQYSERQQELGEVNARLKELRDIAEDRHLSATERGEQDTLNHRANNIYASMGDLQSRIAILENKKRG